MTGAIPAFDHNFVLPPHLGDPRQPSDLSPYPCTTVDLCQTLGTTAARRAILASFLEFRGRLRTEGLTKGFQWLDGSFVEDIEAKESRAPRDLDVVTVFWGYDQTFQARLRNSFPAFALSKASKAQYHLDHYPFDAEYRPAATIELARYWIQLFSHDRQGVWKGMLRIELDTPAEDARAGQQLKAMTP